MKLGLLIIIISYYFRPSTGGAGQKRAKTNYLWVRAGSWLKLPFYQKQSLSKHVAYKKSKIARRQKSMKWKHLKLANSPKEHQPHSHGTRHKNNPPPPTPLLQKTQLCKNWTIFFCTEQSNMRENNMAKFCKWRETMFIDFCLFAYPICCTGCRRVPLP